MTQISVVFESASTPPVVEEWRIDGIELDILGCMYVSPTICTLQAPQNKQIVLCPP